MNNNIQPAWRTTHFLVNNLNGHYIDNISNDVYVEMKFDIHSPQDCFCAMHVGIYKHFPLPNVSNRHWIFIITLHCCIIDLIQKSQNAPVPYPRMLHSEQKCAHFCSEWSILGYGTGAFWDFWNWSIVHMPLSRPSSVTFRTLCPWKTGTTTHPTLFILHQGAP